MNVFSPIFLLFTAVFLPLYFVVPKRAQWGILLAGSVVFYLAAGWQSLLVLGFLTAITYGFSRFLEGALAKEAAALSTLTGEENRDARKALRARGRKQRSRILTAGVLCQLLPLVFFKVAPLSNGIFSTLLLPLGLSYVSLSAVSYVADVARRQTVCERNFLRLALYLFYFPQMWQGPINRYGELAPQLFTPHSFDGARAMSGGLRALWGCFKKLVVADTAAIAVAAILKIPEYFGGTGVLLLILLYSIQIYGDFTGGMDIALGLSHAMGISLYENFDRPFGAASPSDYWHRWHRSMSRFFTDYVFYPLSTGRPAQLLLRLCRRCFGERGGTAVVLWMSTILTWALTGLWHGGSWNFLLWGVFNALAMLIWQALRPLFHRHVKKAPRWMTAAGCILTFCTVGLFRTLDIYRSVPLTLSLWGRAFTPAAYAGLFDLALLRTLELDLPRVILIVVSVVLMTWISRVTPRVGERDTIPWQARLAVRPYLCATVAALLLAAVLIFGNYGLGFDAMEFIYGQY